MAYEDGIARMQVFNAPGQCMAGRSVAARKGDNRVLLSEGGGLPAGSYILRIGSESGRAAQTRFTIAR